MKCLVCKKEIKKSYAAAGLCGTYCLECATKLGFVDKPAKNDFKEGFKEGLAQKQFDKDAEITQLKQQLKKFQSIKEYRVNKLLVKNKKLKQQLAEKDKKYVESLIKLEKESEEQLEKQAIIHIRHLKEKDQDKIEFAIDKLSEVNGILTDTIIEVTQDEMDLNKLCYLEEISARFGNKIEQQIKELKEQK